MASRKGPGLGFWQASAAGTCALSHPHTCQIFGKTKQNKKNPKALTFLGLIFLICQRKRLNKIESFSHVLSFGDESVNPLTTYVRLPLPSFASVAKKFS